MGPDARGSSVSPVQYLDEIGIGLLFYFETEAIVGGQFGPFQNYSPPRENPLAVSGPNMRLKEFWVSVLGKFDHDRHRLPLLITAREGADRPIVPDMVCAEVVRGQRRDNRNVHPRRDSDREIGIERM